MPFLSRVYTSSIDSPLFLGVLANTMLSTVPGLSGAGPNPEGSLLVPVLDAELITNGRITSCEATPNTPSGCPTPASITRAVLGLSGIPVLFMNAGLVHKPTVPMIDLYTRPGQDPRDGPAVPDAGNIYLQGAGIGKTLGSFSKTLVIGECVPGGTTTALCLLRAFGYHARVSSAAIHSPVQLKEEIVETVLARLAPKKGTDAMEILSETGDPMMAAVAGIASAYPGTIFLAGGTQMLAVAALIKKLSGNVCEVVTTVYVRDDPAANSEELAAEIGVPVTFVDPGFGEIAHSGLVRYCIGEVKEGMGCGGAMFLANRLGYTPEEIRTAILSFVTGYCP